MSKTYCGVIKLGLVLLVSLSAGQVQAREVYVTPLNTALGTTTLSCTACHIGSPGKSNANTDMANTYRAGIDIAAADSDNDGFTNYQEANGNVLNFNDQAVNPFTLAKAAESSSSTNVVVTGAGIVTETVITDAYAQTGITVPTGSEVVANVSPLVPTFPATIVFASPVVSSTSMYVVDFNAKTNTPINSGLTFNNDGSVTITGMAANSNILAVRQIPSQPGAGNQVLGENEGIGCMVSQLKASTLWTLLLLLGLGLFVKRKK